MDYYLITFSNTHSAILAQKHLEGKLNYQVMPTLREISNSCGISLKIVSSTYEEILACMKHHPIDKDMYKIYLIKDGHIEEMT